jgi:uncharacterized RDD family membrane protein YckC
MTDPYGQQSFGQPQPFGQPGTPFGAPQNYANWGQRALGWLIDVGPFLVLCVILVPLAFTGGDAFSMLGVVGSLAWLGWSVYNRWILQGNTGQSMGKRVAKVKLVREDTGQPVGPGIAFVRDLAHTVDNVICYVGWLWPLRDDKSQTLADKMTGTIVVTADDAATPFAQPGAQPFAGGYPPAGQQPGQFGAGGFPQQPAAGFGQPQPGQPAPGGFGQPQPGGFEQSQPGGFPQQPAGGGLGQPQPGQPASGGFGQPQSGGFPQQPAPGGFGQPQPGQPASGGFPQQPAPGGFGQPQSGGFPQPGGPSFDEGERTQMLRPDSPGASGEQPERTQMLRPEEAGETQKIDPGSFGQPPQH